MLVGRVDSRTAYMPIELKRGRWYGESVPTVHSRGDDDKAVYRGSVYELRMDLGSDARISGTNTMDVSEGPIYLI